MNNYYGILQGRLSFIFDEGPVTEMRIWSIWLIESDL